MDRKKNTARLSCWSICERPSRLRNNRPKEIGFLEEIKVLLDFLGNLKRTHYCGELRAKDAGSDVIVTGWVARRRDLGNLLFLDVRDRSGIVQVVFNKETQPEAHAKAEKARSEI